MAEFIFTYHGGRVPETPEEGQAAMGRWQAWVQKLGPKLVNPGSPVGITKVLTKDGVSNEPSPHPVMGYSIIEAATMEDALKDLADCPHFEFGGTLEVSEIKPMPM